MGRRPCCSKEQELNRGAWTASEDKTLSDYIRLNGEGKWRNLPERAGLKRCGKSCRLRWLNYLRPGIKRGSISEAEEDLIFRLHKLLGNRWALIAGRLPGRTDNEIKNYWHTKLSKTLKPKPDVEESSPKSSSARDQNSEESPRFSKKQRLSEPPLDQDKEKTTGVVRTKATRFTKPVVMVVPREDQSSHGRFDDEGTVSEAAPYAGPRDQTMNLEKDACALQGFVSGFGADFDVDEDFLSGFFNSDWISEHPGEPSMVYVSSDQTLLFPAEETLPLTEDLESIVSLIESSDHLEDWLQV